ncbi:ABC transporter ATP-binding protein [Caulobacter sp. Root656]|jgi:phospholipid/cholesterol/gamma-HCH transport system ATP-binding protein|uniref:Phospholipid/cholesterol/gamma-HCH transport system ATP-binding protein n=1 Tax=Caulobacter rhizosphaerae TaxID=2010972 RepID=A0ABU1N4J8_9CAUL|nr:MULTISPECIES: ATP-binding cassette domain-containing protein [Caulobacter]KQZ31212.1 ABC transporter ATP-binding protein [Caulobacter sp. Root1472]KRA57226.1 ABC transporter ATP-binding protein [Caulobacter sp. Root656]MDR6533363.1 phospholipid/cholesterol/gamma-HCH transport system ATP-binding protein [Caulobacter rhizosphaerae]
MTDIPKLEWKGVSKRFDGPVLDGLDLSVAAGRSLVIIGGSGQGKSVTIKVAMGLVRPDAGQVLVDGEDLVGVSGASRRKLFERIGVLFQGAALFDSLSVWENVAFRLINADGVPRKEAKARAVEALGRVHLGAHVADSYPSELSGGMQKRVGLARAVVANPEIIFFDEPTTGLDPITSAAINELIVDQVKGLGCTAVSITHDLASARTIGDEIAMLHAGKIVWRGAPAELDRTDNPYVRQFVDGRADGPMASTV